MGEENWQHSSQQRRSGRMKIPWLANPAGGTSVRSQSVPSANQMGKPVVIQCTNGAKIKSQKLVAREFPITRKLYQQKGIHATGILKKLDCAWCADKKVQCKDSQAAQSCGSFCMSESSPQCDGVASSCLNIPVCGFGGSCDRKTGKCKCGKGFSGNGFQCFNSSSGDPATNPNGNVLVTIGTDSKYFVYPDGSDMFPSSP